MDEQANPLAIYLQEADLKLSGLARKMGRSPSTLTRALRGERDPTLTLARAVETATEGKVSAAQFINVCLSASSAQSITTPEAAP